MEGPRAMRAAGSGNIREALREDLPMDILLGVGTSSGMEWGRQHGWFLG